MESLEYYTLPKILLTLVIIFAVLLGVMIGRIQPIANMINTYIHFYSTITIYEPYPIYRTTTIYILVNSLPYSCNLTIYNNHIIGVLYDSKALLQCYSSECTYRESWFGFPINVTVFNEQYNGSYIYLIMGITNITSQWLNGTVDCRIVHVNGNVYPGAQYVAWVYSLLQFNHPAPCYVPFVWTINYWLEGKPSLPSGGAWNYYCVNGSWVNYKP